MCNKSKKLSSSNRRPQQQELPRLKARLCLQVVMATLLPQQLLLQLHPAEMAEAQLPLLQQRLQPRKVAITTLKWIVKM